jgi:hypothetical protein
LTGRRTWEDLHHEDLPDHARTGGDDRIVA